MSADNPNTHTSPGDHPRPTLPGIDGGSSNHQIDDGRAPSGSGSGGIRLPPISFISGLQRSQAPLSVSPLAMPKLSSTSSGSPVQQESTIEHGYPVSHDDVNGHHGHHLLHHHHSSAHHHLQNGTPPIHNSPHRFDYRRLSTSPAMPKPTLPLLEHRNNSPSSTEMSPRLPPSSSIGEPNNNKDASSINTKPSYKLPGIASFQSDIPRNRNKINSILNDDSGANNAYHSDGSSNSPAAKSLSTPPKVGQQPVSAAGSYAQPTDLSSQPPKHRTYSSSSNINSLLNNDASSHSAPEPQTMQTRIIIHQHHPTRFVLNKDETSSTGVSIDASHNSPRNFPYNNIINNTNGYQSPAVSQQNQQQNQQQQHHQHQKLQLRQQPLLPPHVAHSQQQTYTQQPSHLPTGPNDQDITPTYSPVPLNQSMPARIQSQKIQQPAVSNERGVKGIPTISAVVNRKKFEKPQVIVSNTDALKFAAQFPRKQLGTMLYTLSPSKSLQELLDRNSKGDDKASERTVEELEEVYKREIRKNSVFLLPELRNHINSILTIHIPKYYLSYKNNPNLSLKTRSLWGTDIYTDDSDVVAILKHCGFIDDEEIDLEQLDGSADDERVRNDAQYLKDLKELIGEQENKAVTPGYENPDKKPNVLFFNSDAAKSSSEDADKKDDTKTTKNKEADKKASFEEKVDEANGKTGNEDKDATRDEDDRDKTINEDTIIEDNDIVDPIRSKNKSDLTIELLILPTLKEYHGSFRNYLNSRSWTTSHDGVSIALYSVRYDNLSYKGINDSQKVYTFIPSKPTHHHYINQPFYQTSEAINDAPDDASNSKKRKDESDKLPEETKRQKAA